MPKVILEFNSIEDDEDIWLAMNGRKLYCALWDIREQVMRNRCKYKEYDIEEVEKEVEDINAEICEVIGDLLDHVS